jgi:hypothetical protein
MRFIVMRNVAKIVGVAVCICDIGSDRPRETGKGGTMLIIKKGEWGLEIKEKETTKPNRN